MSTPNLTPSTSGAPTRTATPNPRFTPQSSTAEDLLKAQTVGLVHLSDFRKRRAEALEQKDLGRFTPSSRSGNATPGSDDGALTPANPAKKKKKKGKDATKGKVSFGVDDEEEDRTTAASTNPTVLNATSSMASPDMGSPIPAADADNPTHILRKRLGPNNSVAFTPKIMTKSALLRESHTREQLRKEFLAMQEAVKATEILIPFVFYDGTNIPGGVCKVRKGDYIWLFLDRSRKVGAELGIGGSSGGGGSGGGGGGKEKDSVRREWARVGVDDLMLVRGEVIIPHHYDFYHFIVNKCLGPTLQPLFDYSADPPLSFDASRFASTSPSPHDDDDDDDSPHHLVTLAPPAKKSSGAVTPADARLEGRHDDPNFTKVVDRRWYERNKHIFPASVWEVFDAGKDYAKGSGRRDGEGNAFFFS